MLIKILLWPKGDIKVLQAETLHLKAQQNLASVSSKPLAGWMLFGRLAGFLLWGIKQLKTLCRLMFWQLQPPGCSGAGRHRERHTVNTHTHTHTCTYLLPRSSLLYYFHQSKSECKVLLFENTDTHTL